MQFRTELRMGFKIQQLNFGQNYKSATVSTFSIGSGWMWNYCFVYCKICTYLYNYLIILRVNGDWHQLKCFMDLLVRLVEFFLQNHSFMPVPVVFPMNNHGDKLVAGRKTNKIINAWYTLDDCGLSQTKEDQSWRRSWVVQSKTAVVTATKDRLW